jgi:hypothetical protein
MEEKKLTEHESLQIIQNMIEVAKQEHRESGAGWLIWGWLLFIASITSAILMYLNEGKYIAWVWTTMLITGMIIYVIARFMSSRVTGAKTYMGELLDKLGNGFFISLFIIIAASSISHSTFAFGYYYILYAFWMFIYGSALRFRPLIVGAFVNWAAALAIFIIDDFMYDMIVSAVAILVGYLIPGYILRAEFRRNAEIRI